MTPKLPPGWKYYELETLVEFNPKNLNKDDSEALFAPMKLIPTKYLDKMEFETKLWKDIKSGFTHFQEGDVVVAKITPCFENAKSAIVEHNRQSFGAGTTEIFVLRPKEEKVLAKYLLAFFKTHHFLQKCTQNMRGAVGQKRVPKEYLLKFPVPLPQLEEQKRIVAKLDRLLARVDSCRAHLDRATKVIKRFRQSVLNAAVTGQLTANINQQICNIESFGNLITEMRNGLSPKPTDNPPGEKILRISSVRPGKINFTDHRYLAVSRDVYRQYSLNKGDLLFTRYNGTLDFVGVCAIVKADHNDYIYPDKLIRVRVKIDRLLPEYAEIAFRSSEIRKQIEECVKSSAGQKGISGADLKTVRIPLPEIARQKEIVTKAEALFFAANQFEAKLYAAKERVDNLTASILAKAFRGELL